MITFYDNKGKIVFSALCSEATKQSLLNSPDYSQYAHLDSDYHPDKFYIDIVTLQPIEIPLKPSADYIFSYDTYTWIIDSARATKRARNIRDSLLVDSDWTDTLSAQNRFGSDLYNQWQTYRQALRDVPEQAGFPLSIIWPTPPA